MLAPGSLLPPGRLVPRGQLWAGVPARYVRNLTADEVPPSCRMFMALLSIAALQLTPLGGLQIRLVWWCRNRQSWTVRLTVAVSLRASQLEAQVGSFECKRLHTAAGVPACSLM